MTERLRAYIEYAIVGTLGLFAFSQLMISVVNPESFFWGLRLVGLAAQFHMIVLALVAVILIVFLLAKARGIALLCTIFYGYVVTETVWSNYRVFGSVTVGPLPLIGLLLSVVLWLGKRYAPGSASSPQS